MVRNSLFAAAILLAAAGAGTADTNEAAYEVIANAYGFGTDIPECPGASRNIREIAIDDLKVDVREMTTGLDVEYRTYAPGATHWGQAKFTSACTLGGSKELQIWWQDVSTGKDIRKNITVTLLKSDRTPARSYVLLECLPTHWSSRMDTQNNEEVEELWVRPGGIVLVDEPGRPSPSGKAEATVSDKFAQVRGFKVKISSATGKEVDTAWESIDGGEHVIELTDENIGSDKFQSTSPGHKSVGELILRGAMTNKRAALCTWINETVQGKDWKRTLTVQEVASTGRRRSVDFTGGASKQYEYKDCFPTRYVFPRLSVYNQSGNVLEEVVVKAVREPVVPSPIGKLMIEGAPEASASALCVAVDDRALDMALVPKIRDMRDPVITILFPAGRGSEMEKWYNDCRAGSGARKRIVVSTDRSSRTAPTYNLLDCFPVSFAKATDVNGNTMEEVQIKPVRCELK